MILFPNCKINLGLDILRKRDDGFHDISTVMIAVAAPSDILEVTECEGDDILLELTGNAVDCDKRQNLCYRAYRLMREEYGIGGVKALLHKNIPHGAGLGGGSADAAFMINALNSIFKLALPIKELESIASRLGSDTPFFIQNTPKLCEGRGERMTPVPNPLLGRRIVIAKPDFPIPTPEAYAVVKPRTPDVPLTERLRLPVEQWRDNIVNGFEEGVFPQYPQLGRIKDALYASGAVYASMSGSGSAVFGVFDNEDSRNSDISDIDRNERFVSEMKKKLESDFRNIKLYSTVL